MPETYPHLPLLREEPVNPRRTHPAPIRVPEPRDWHAFGSALRQRLQSARERAAAELGGFDDRRLIKLELGTPLDPAEFRKISHEIEIVSQEDKTVVLAFATEAALAEFEARLSTLAEGKRPTYRNLLFALKSFDHWTEDDRQGWALKEEGWPEQDAFVLDVELWPVALQTDRDRSWQAFEAWLAQQGIEWRDAIKQPHLILYRVRVSREQAQRLLRHRDVRLVDLPPRYGLQISALQTDIQDLPPVPAPPAGAPGVVVLDSGVATGHPLLAPAVGDAQSFIPPMGPADEHGHGTLVAGIALYGDVEETLRARAFVPKLRLFSGRILDANNASDDKLIENQVDEAVRYFYRNYGCRVFNLSYGDRRKPYLGRHVRGLAVTLDALTRELGVLFVVPAGNFEGAGALPADWRADYPRYLLASEAALLDPAPALNALAVGSLARWDATFNAQRYRDDPAEQPIARRDQPSPFTRSGPSVGGAIKPDLVDYGGNSAVNVRVANRRLVRQGLGELSTSKDFAAAARLLAEESGTSFAAPHVAHLAARILAEHPQADHNLLRALLVAHAAWPQPCETLFPDKTERLRVCGYGRVQDVALARSNEQEVTLIANDATPDRSHHFYEVPLPGSFVEGRQRTREITVALAHSPAVRTTRISYKSCDMEFRLVWADDLNHVSKMFHAATSRDKYQRLSEMNGARIGSRNRGAGTVQVDHWMISRFTEQRRAQKLFVVVTRIDENWGRDLTLTAEPYALAVVLRDRDNAEARLYTQLQVQLRARVQARVRA